MKLLLVEDSKRLAERMRQRLESVYMVDVVATGREGIEKAQAFDYDLIVLDLGLPDISGLGVCQRLRSSRVTTPILILTGNDDMPTRVALLEAGADDYMTKPFNISELLARLQALGRRPPLRPGRQLRYSDLTIDLDTRQVFKGEQHIPLRRKEFDILEYLVSSNGRVLTREMIINHVWDQAHEGWDNTVNVHIKHLRDKIDRPFGTSIIKTAYGLGYKVDVPQVE